MTDNGVEAAPGSPQKRSRGVEEDDKERVKGGQIDVDGN
jgi:hypothetical protein